MAEREMVAPCGIYCPGCPGYQAQFDPALAEDLSKRFNMPTEKVICPGCRPGKSIVMGWTRPCPTYTCVEAKGFEFCYQCEEFPCLKLTTYLKSPRPHNTKVYNLLMIQKLGLEGFLERVEELTRLYYEGAKRHGGTDLKLPKG